MARLGAWELADDRSWLVRPENRLRYLSALPTIAGADFSARRTCVRASRGRFVVSRFDLVLSVWPGSAN